MLSEPEQNVHTVNAIFIPQYTLKMLIAYFSCKKQVL